MDGAPAKTTYTPDDHTKIRRGSFFIGLFSEFHAVNNYLDVTFHETYSNTWLYQWRPGEWGDACYLEHFGVYSENWSGTKVSDEDFEVVQRFDESQDGRTAILRYDGLEITRQIYVPSGNATFFNIIYVLKNNGTSKLSDVRFFEVVDYDIVDPSNDYGWYVESTDTVWQNDDRYFKNGFRGNKTSSNHGMDYYYDELYEDWDDGELNGKDKYPDEGTSDVAVGLQWNIGDLEPQESWSIEITFYFGETAGIYADAGPDQVVGRGQPVVLDASGSRSVSNITRYEWDLDNDGVFEVNVTTPIYVYEEGWTELGDHIVTLRVTDEDGRTDTDTVIITVIPNIDLTVLGVNISKETIRDGEIIIFNATVKNVGTEDIEGNFYVRFEVDGIYVGKNMVSGLSAGSVAHVTQSWEAVAGNHTLKVYVDESDLIRETNESNNTLTIAIPEIPYPDLVISSLTVPTDDFNDGDVITLRAEVKNIGNDTLRVFYVGFKVDGNLIGTQRVAGLSNGSSVNISQDWIVSPGEHEIKVVADYYNDVVELNETNNSLTIALPEIPYPDLVVTDIVWTPSNIRYGDRVIFSAHVDNIGGKTSRSFYVRFEIDGGYIGHGIVSGLNANESAVVNVSWIASEGSHTIKVIADSYDSVVEGNESNNEMVKSLPEIPGPPKVKVLSPNGGEIWYGARNITWIATSPEGLELRIKIELYDGRTYKLIADNLPNTGVYVNWDTSKLADGSPVPDGVYYKIRITATDTNGVSGSDMSDDWFTIWNTPKVEIRALPSSYGYTIEKKNATYLIKIENKQPFSDTFNVTLEEIDDVLLADIDKTAVSIDAWESEFITLNVTDDDPGTYRVKVIVTSQNGASSEIIITTHVREAFSVDVLYSLTQTSIGGNLTYKIKIKNNQDESDNFTIDIGGISWLSLKYSREVRAGGVEEIPFNVVVPSNATAGDYTIEVRVKSSNLGTERFAYAPINVSPTPLIFDLKPANNTRTGSTEIVISWRTSVNSSTEVYIKSDAEENFTLIEGSPGIYHVVRVTNLSRNTWYTFYVRSVSDYGVVQSENRRLFVDNGISFSQKVYEFTIERDYNQERTIRIINTDDESHEVLLSVSNIPEDLAVNFVGEGSTDQVILLHPGESRDVTIVFHAQDAQYENYTLLLNLTNLDEEDIKDFAYINLNVHFPIINFSVEEISTDPYTLAKTIRITNRGDPLTDLTVYASGIDVVFQPSIDHAYLGRGQSLEFKVVPILSKDFNGASGEIVVRAAGVEKTLHVNFTIPEGKSIYIGTVPNMSIEFDDHFDNDRYSNTNPSGEIKSYLVETENGSSTMFIAKISVKVKQDGKPASDANVSLELKGRGFSKTFYGETDMWGRVIFIVTGPADNYTYRAYLAGYNISTETRTFSANKTPAKKINTSAVLWLNASDSSSNFDLTDKGFVTLDSPPFVFKAKIPPVQKEKFNAIMYLYGECGYYNVKIPGVIEGDTVTFRIDSIEPDVYKAQIVVASSNELLLSDFREFNFTINSFELLPFYTFREPYPYNETHMILQTINVEEKVSDPDLITMFLGAVPSENQIVLHFAIVANKTYNTVLNIRAINDSGSILYEMSDPLQIEKNDIIFINVTIPSNYTDGNIVEYFEVDFKVGNYAWLYINCSRKVVGILDALEDMNGGWLSWLNLEEQESGIASAKAVYIKGWEKVVGKAVFDSIIEFIDIPGLKEVCQGLLNLLKDRNPEAAAEAISGLESIAEDKVRKKLAKVFGKKMAEEIATSTGKSKTFWKFVAKYGGRWIKSGFKNTALFIKILFVGYANFKSGYDTYKEEMKNKDKAGLKQSYDIGVSSCINHAPLVNRFYMPSDIPQYCSPTRNIENVYLTLYFPRTPPTSYRPFTTIIKINEHEVGRIVNEVPKGYYVFEVDPSYLNYADVGVAENTITLDVEGMNRGYYVPLQGYKLDILFKKAQKAVCAGSQDEANQVIASNIRALKHDVDFVISSADISLSNSKPSENDEVNITAKIYNLGSSGSDVVVSIFVDDVEVDTIWIPYIAPFSTYTIETTWIAERGDHNVKIVVNSDRDIEESDYTNNEASKTISVIAQDTEPPIISNLKPSDGAVVTTNRPLISADLADPGSGINTTAVRIFVDGIDVTSNATVISSRVWYIPDLLEDGTHTVTVYAEDNRGNSKTCNWSFTVRTENKPPIPKFSYSPCPIVVNQTVEFNASLSYDPDGFIVSYEWDFGDGNVTSTAEETIKHSYSEAGSYEVTLTVTDDDGATNSTTKVVTVQPDTIPPASVTNLTNVTYAATYINWTWDDPADADFSHVMVYLDGKFQTNVSAGVQHYNATGLTPDTAYMISTRTVDEAGNVNQTWVNHTARTARAEPSVSISTDKYEYAAGDVMLINVTLRNPAGEWRRVRFLWCLDLPDYGLRIPIINNTSLWLPPGYEKTFMLRWRLPRWRLSFNASWYVALFDARTSELISEDHADWEYAVKTKRITPEEFMEKV